MIRTVMIAAAAVALAGAAGAQTQLSAHLMGSNEKPAGDPAGMGHATVKVDTTKNQVCYDLMVEKLGSAATMAHIHKAAADASGPVAVPLAAPDAAGKSSGCATVAPDVAKDIAANPGGYYVNVHTDQFKAGAVRGQLSK